MSTVLEEYRFLYKSFYRHCLSREEQLSLLIRYKREKDMDARDRFIMSQYCWVMTLLRSVFGLCDMLIDLVQDAVLDLHGLIDTFSVDNPTKASFRTYARVVLLRRANKRIEKMKDGMVVKGNVRRQSVFVRMVFKECVARGLTEREALSETTARFYDKFSKRDYRLMPPYKKERAEERVRNLLLLGRAPVSLDHPIGEDEDGDTFVDTLADEDANPEDIVVNRDLLRAIYEAIDSDLLDDRERYILEHYVGLHEAERMSVTRIAEMVGVSRQRTSAILMEIRFKLRKALGIESA